MEKIILSFEGYSELDKNDLVVEKIVDGGGMEQVEVSKLSTKKIIEMFNRGEVYINFEKSYANTLDGSLDLELEH